MLLKTRHGDAFRATRDDALGPTGHTSADLRQAVHDRALAAATRTDLPASEDELAALDPLVQKIARNAYKVVDDDLQSLLDAGRSQDEVFEAVICAAIGAASARFDAGSAALSKLVYEETLAAEEAEEAEEREAAGGDA